MSQSLLGATSGGSADARHAFFSASGILSGEDLTYGTITSSASDLAIVGGKLSPSDADYHSHSAVTNSASVVERGSSLVGEGGGGGVGPQGVEELIEADNGELLIALVSTLRNLALHGGGGVAPPSSSSIHSASVNTSTTNAASGTGPNAVNVIRQQHQNKRSSSSTTGGVPTSSPSSPAKITNVNHKIKSDCLANNVGEVLTHVGRLHNAERRLKCEIQGLGDVVGFNVHGDDLDDMDNSMGDDDDTSSSTTSSSSGPQSTLSEL